MLYQKSKAKKEKTVALDSEQMGKKQLSGKINESKSKSGNEKEYLIADVLRVVMQRKNLQVLTKKIWRKKK
jgi:hypothetical protein